MCLDAADAHPFEPAVIIGRNDSPSSQPHSTLAGLNGPQPEDRAAAGGLSHAVALGMERRRHANQPFFTENVPGARPFLERGGSASTCFRGIEAGVASHDPHLFAHHPDDPLIIDAPLREGGRRLSSICCCGSSRPLQPLGPDGVASRKACCDGQTVSVCGPARSGHTISQLCKILEVSEALVRTRLRLVSLLPVPMGSLVAAQTAMHRPHLEWGMPVISADAVAAD